LLLLLLLLISTSLDEAFNHLWDTPVSLRLGRQIFQLSVVFDPGLEVVAQESRGYSSVSLCPVLSLAMAAELLTTSEQCD
jgi:hypothetical protein